MKILHIYDHTEPLQSGYVFRSRSLRTALQNLGHVCDVFSMPRHYANGDKTVYTQEVENFNGTEYFRSKPVKLKLPIIREISEIFSGALYIKKLIKEHDYDYLHAHSPVLGAISALLGRYLSKKKDLKIVYEIRAFWEDAAVDHGTLKENNFKYRFIRCLEKWACKKVDHIYPICQPLKDDLVKRGIPENKMTIIPNILTENAFKQDFTEQDIDALRIKHHLSKTDYILGFIGSFYRYEGLEDLLPTMKFFKQGHHRVKLLLVGGGPVEESLRTYINQHDLESHVIMTGRISHNQVSLYYQLCSAMIYPRRSMRLTETVTPLKPLEAAAAGIPVILSDIGGHRELLEDQETGFFIKDFTNPEISAKKIWSILTQKDKLQTVKIAALDYVKSHHDPNKIAKLYYK